MGWVRLDRPSPVTGPGQWPDWAAGMHGLNYLRPVFFFCNKRCRKKGKRKALPGDDEGEGGDEDESDGLVWRMFFFPLLLCFFFFVMGSPFLWFFFGFLFPCVLLSFSRSLLFFPSSPLTTHWPFIGAESIVCSPIRLFFPWQRISPAGTWILDSILIFSRIVILCRVNRLHVWMERKHQQSCHCWTVGGRLWLGLQRRVRRWSLIGLGTLADQNQFVPACVELST